MTPLAAIHVGKSRLGLDDETYRGLLLRVTGKRSAKQLLPSEAAAVLDEMRRLGFEPASKGARRTVDGPFGPKLQALWISGYQLGVVNERADEALLAFVERQTGISHTRFLRDAVDARKAIEALKGWLTREAGVDWSPRKLAPAWQNGPKFRIVEAQWRKLIDIGAVQVAGEPMRALVATAAVETRRAGLEQLTGDDWSTLMAALGRRLRHALAGTKQRAA